VPPLVRKSASGNRQTRSSAQHALREAAIMSQLRSVRRHTAIARREWKDVTTTEGTRASVPVELVIDVTREANSQAGISHP
jgi:hypothetical protein